MKTIGALIPIRLDSSRLPQKALLDVAGLPALQRLITQVAACGLVSRERIIVCTTERTEDDPLVAAVGRLGASVFRGSTDDLIDRMYRAAKAHGLNAVLQVDGDDICADPGYMAECLQAVLQGKTDVACCADGLPLGAASKAFSFDCLEKIFQAYVPGVNDTGFGYYLTKSGMFRVTAVAPLDPAHVMPDLRLTLDYPQDLQLFSELFQHLRGTRDAAVGVAEICALVRSNPQLKQVNAGLDEGYWERTRALMARHPLKLRVGDRTIQLDPESQS
jgi:spore coat polysaccharide biosynthesis protein SpsF